MTVTATCEATDLRRCPYCDAPFTAPHQRGEWRDHVMLCALIEAARKVKGNGRK